PDCKIIEITDIFGMNIYYHLKNDEKLPANALNSFNILMQSARYNELDLIS
ncbi:5956_t:CDS:1, partial [Racocetra persica]